jgi:hypothetical protein
MCEAPSSAGTQNGPEVSGPYVEMTRNLRHREVAKCLGPFWVPGLNYAACIRNRFCHVGHKAPRMFTAFL